MVGIAAIVVGALPVLLLAGGCLRLSFHLAQAESPSYAACLGWVLGGGFAARGATLAVRDFIAPATQASGLEVTLMSAACYAVVPFFVLRLFVCENTLDALRVHALNLTLSGLLAFSGFVVFQHLS